MNKLAVLIILFIFLSACGQASLPAAGTPTQSPPLPSRTQTSSRAPTLTPTYTPNLSPTPTFDATYHALETLADATWSVWQTQGPPATQTAMAQFTRRCPVYEPPAPDHFFTVSPQSHEFLISPDGDWLAQDCWGTDWQHPDQYFLLVSDRSGNRSVTVPYRPLFSEGDFSPYNALFVPVLFWSPDSQSLYFSKFSCCADTSYSFGGIDMTVWYLPLYRLNVQTGVWAQVLEGAHYFSLSPTGRRLAYVTLDSDWLNEIFITKMNVLDLQTGALKTVDHENTVAAGYVLWSADGLKVYYSILNGPYHYHDEPPPFDYQIFEYNIASGQATLLKAYPQSTAVPFPYSFTADGKLIIRLATTLSRRWNTIEHSTEIVDLTTLQVMTATPTP